MASFGAKAKRMDLMGFVADHMGHFSLYDVPNLLFAVLLASLLGFLLARVGAGTGGPEARSLALWAGTTALAVGLVRAQLPLAIALLAVVLIAGPVTSERRDRALFFGALVMGLGCGSGAALITLAVALPYLFVVRWAFGPNGSA